MKKKSLKIFRCFIVLFFISLNLFADKIQVTSTTVGTALSTASPGDTIIFTNGTYSNQVLNLSNSGTSVNPIIFKAETLGGVVFNGSSSRIIITGDYWIIDGFKWDNVQPNSSDIVIYFNGANNNIFRNNTISNSGRITAGSKTGLIRLMNSSQNNILEYNRLDNLINVGIQVWAWAGDNLNTGNIIRHNYFTNHSSYEFIQLGQGGTSAFVDQHSVVESNLFENFNMKDPELISSKTSFNIIRHNTFRNCLSMVVLRTGQNSVVDGNWFFNSRGIRVHDKNHIIINNYIEGIPEVSTTTDTEGIVLYCGNMVRPNTNGTHYPADSVLVANNTIRNHKNVHLLIGRNGSSWSEKPNAVTIKNNLVTNNVGTAIQNEASTNAIWIQNMVYPTGTGIAGNVGNVLITDPQLSLSGEIYKLQSGSPAIDNATNEALVSIDIDGQPRGTSLDIGADEYSGANIIYGPLDGTKVGPGHAALNTTTYTLNVTADNGTVVKVPDASTYNSGTSVVLTATPDTGYVFTSWSGDATGTTNPLTITMDANKNITANFSIITYTLNVTADNGTVVKVPNASTYNSGTSVVLTATPDTGYEFTSWGGDATGTTNPLTVTMDANKNITANFAPVTFNLPIVNVWATANDGNVPANTIDNDLNTRWSAKNGPHSITWELNSQYKVEYLMIAWYVGNTRISYFDIAVSTDNVTWTTVLTGGTSSGTTLQQEMVDIPDTDARYVRYIGYGNEDNTWNSITEVDIYGKINTLKSASLGAATDINEFDANIANKIYPNPFSDHFTLSFNLDKSSDVNITIIDITGRVVRNINAGNFAAGVNSIVIQRENMIKGIYLLKVNAGANYSVSKIIVE